MPAAMGDSDIEECSKFRTKERFPALTYYYKKNGATIWRSSQPKVSLCGVTGGVGGTAGTREQGGPEDDPVHHRHP